MASYRSKCMEVVTRLYDDDGNALITNQTLNDFFTANQDKIEMACLIVHDKDPYVEEDIEKLRKKGVPNPESYLGKIKPRHVHIPIKWRNSVYYNSVAKQLGLQDGQIEKPRVKRKQFEAMATYITHKSPKEQAKGKHVYPDSAVQVIIGGFDYTKMTEDYLEWVKNRNSASGCLASNRGLSCFVEGNKVIIGDMAFAPDSGDDDDMSIVSCFHDILKPDAVRFLANMVEAGKFSISDLQDKIGFAEYNAHKKDFDAARVRYVKAHHVMGSRYSFYIGPKYDLKEGGGIGKTAMSRMLAQALFPRLSDFEAFHEVSDLNVPFEGYDGQPCIIWNESRSGGMMKILGREKVFDILEPHPGKAQMNVKYGSTILTNTVNIINGITPYREFMNGLAGEYKDRYGEEHKAESKDQVFRRFPFIIEITQESFDFYVNQGFFSDLFGYQDFICAAHVGESIRRIVEKYTDKARIAVGKELLSPVTDKVNELREKQQSVKRSVDELDDSDFQFDIQTFEPGDDGALPPSGPDSGRNLVGLPAPADAETDAVDVTLYASVREFPDYAELSESVRDELREAAERDWHAVRHCGTPEYRQHRVLLDKAEGLDADAEKYRGRADAIEWMWGEFEKRALAYFATLSPSAVKNVHAVTKRNASKPKLLVMSCSEFLSVDKAKWWVRNGGESFRPTDSEILRVFASAYETAFGESPYDVATLGVVDKRVQPSEWRSKAVEAAAEAERLRAEADGMLAADVAKGDVPEPSDDEVDAVLAERYADRLVQVEADEPVDGEPVDDDAEFDPADLYS